MVVEQWPHILKATITTDSSQDANGDLIPGTSTEVELKCRYRQNPGSKTVQLVDGETIVYKGTCLMKDKNHGLKYGDIVEVVGFIGEAPIIQVLPHQFRTRITL